MTVYLIDTNVLIQAQNEYYGMDFCPAFWDWLLESNLAGTVASISAVSAELRDREDEDQLSRWTTKRSAEFFLEPDGAVFLSAKQIGTWVSDQSYTAAAVDEFLGSTDHLLIAHALTRDCSVVTHEKPSGSRKKVKIPNVCEAFGVKCIAPFEMLRLQGAKFVLDRGMR